MDFEKLTQEIMEKIDGFNDVKVKTDEELKGLTDRVTDLTGKIEKLQLMRKTGFTQGTGLFSSGEEDEAAKFMKWFKASIEGDETVIKQMRSDNDADGGYLVPDEFAPRLLRLITRHGLARQLATIIPMSRDKLVFPTLINGVTVYWGSAMGGQNWATATDGVTETKPGFGQVTLDIDDMYCLVPIANQLIEDSAIDVANLIVTLIAEAVAKEEDRVAFIGDVDGAQDPFNGIINAGATMVTADGSGYTGLTADNLLDMTDAIEGDDDNAVFIMHRTILSVARKLKDKNGNYILQNPMDGEPATIWGYPFYKSAIMPSVNSLTQKKPFVVFGDMRQLYIGDRKRMAIATSTHAGFTKNQTIVRMVERVAIDVPLAKAFSALQPSSATTTTTA